ncbi:two-component system sensor histidine kinase UhpB [Luteibacter rhizovicinus]|uniref:histidine kinase n=1 Tax=Luteibacter rhizovicinus TaxID=242606 RepID=A0A4V2W3A2_9GAMM|nr:MASE1 domain-containing protein [Luteibacter rhizovicinus]TCV91169.1 two-component system sensor histidine kinase UhpB [Luteibacter rhizovicinus]
MRPSVLHRYAGPLLGLGYFALWILLWPTEQPYWVLPFGLRFGALLLMRTRDWGWIIGAEIAGSAVCEWRSGMPIGGMGFLLGDVPEPVMAAMCLWLLRRAHLHASLNTPEDVARLLLSAMVTATVATAGNAAMMASLHPAAPVEMLGSTFGSDLLGNYLGVLLVVPVLVLIARERPTQAALAELLLDGLLVMLPSLAILVTLSEYSPQPQFARVLSLAPVLFFAFRHGWRGAGLAMLITSVGLNVTDDMVGRGAPTAAAHLFLAVAGTGTLMLGAATDALRRSSERVAQQNVHLAAANQRLDQLARQLRDAARGNLQAEESQRRHMAAELHDELGQNLTAIQTHIKLAQGRLGQAGLEDIGTSINGILAHMRRALHRMLDSLRPSVLDEFGLLRALDEGPLRDMLAAAGIHYRTDLSGDPRLLDDDTLTAIYRVVQESATNAVRHSGASEFRLRLRIGVRGAVTLALLDIRDNGAGLPPAPAPVRLDSGGRGLQGMSDRITALGGIFRIRPEIRGLHLRVLLRSGPVSEQLLPGVSG